MNREDGLKIAEVVQDAVAWAEEHVEGARLRGVVVTLSVEDDDGTDYFVTETWPRGPR